ncbi:metalloregulator ArsR/SmtB family transcription factor [Brevundimonas diminuta]|uniref:ArsR/SmtB family transcription factor n=1 Tax=Brevundimonas diminuta TaxID=293 RepID=UPI0020985687|nr:metalloregulator ArsR/SmtB family transcription factor [Brevundimonas diminuta]MCO8017850.1 metalloregulator ArsR/SmtB family transcription factor [Brevundimonas diminuta]MCO8021370.1 metalloregulator ArsR/SmtB family transcription factor [Brevundimonas diminuta]
MSSPKFLVFEHIADLARALSSPQRLELLDHISQGERSVEALAALCGMSEANTSHHLKQLRQAGLIQSRRSGKNVIYQLGGASPDAILAALRAHVEASRAEVQTIISDYYERLDAMEPVKRNILLERMAHDEVVLLDVRPQDEYRLGHIPGALNITLADLEQKLANMPPDREIVAYCRGPYCVLSFEAVALLRRKGFHARRLEDGLPEWRAAGLAVEAETAQIR